MKCSVCGAEASYHFVGGNGCEKHWPLLFRHERMSIGFRVECAIRIAIIRIRRAPLRLRRMIFG